MSIPDDDPKPTELSAWIRRLRGEVFDASSAALSDETTERLRVLAEKRRLVCRGMGHRWSIVMVQKQPDTDPPGQSAMGLIGYRCLSCHAMVRE